jgi:hypothetical protein
VEAARRLPVNSSEIFLSRFSAILPARVSTRAGTPDNLIVSKLSGTGDHKPGHRQFSRAAIGKGAAGKARAKPARSITSAGENVSDETPKPQLETTGARTREFP